MKTEDKWVACCVTLVLCSVFIGCNLPDEVKQYVDNDCDHKCKIADSVPDFSEDGYLTNGKGKKVSYAGAIREVYTWMMRERSVNGEFVDGDAYWLKETLTDSMGKERMRLAVKKLAEEIKIREYVNQSHVETEKSLLKK